MAGPFDFEDDQEEDLFSWVPDAAAPTIQSSSQLTNTALLGALAYQRQKSDEATLQEVTDRIKGFLENGQEGQIRDGIARSRKDSEIAYLRELQTTLPPETDLRQLLQEERDLDAQPLDPHSLEHEGLAQLQENGAHDTTQAAVMEEELKTYRGSRVNVLDQILELQEKQALLENLHDKVQEEYSAQGVVSRVWDWIGAGIDPTATARQHVNIAPATTNVFLNPGKNWQEQRDWIMSLPLEDFKKALPDYEAILKRRSGIFQQNQLTILQAIEDTMQFSDNDLVEYNFLIGLDAATSGALGVGYRTGKNVIRHARVMGNRAGAANTAASTLIREQAGAETLAGIGKAVPGSDAVEESISSFHRPGGTPGIGLSGEIADKLETLKVIAEDVKNAPRTPRVTLEQQQDLITKTAERAENRYRGRKIVDLKRADGVDQWTTNAMKIADEHDQFMQDIQGQAFRGLQEKFGVRIAFPEGQKLVPGKANTVTIFQRNKPVGNIEFEYNRKAQDIKIHDVRSNKGDAEPTLSLGPKNVRRLLTQLQNMFPEAKTISGLRISGARKSSSINKDVEDVTVPLKPSKASRVTPSDLPLPRIGKELPYEVSKDMQSGLTRVHLYIGNNSRTGGWVNEMGAKAAARRMGFDLKDIQFHPHAGQWYIKTTDIVPESGISTPRLTPDELPRVGPKSQWMKSLDSIAPQVWNNERIQRVWQRSGMQQDTVNRILKPITKLSKKQAKTLRIVIVNGRDWVDPTTGKMTGKWFSPGEFHMEWERITGDTPNDNTILAYNAYRIMDELNTEIMRTDLWIDKARRGVITGRAYNPQTRFDTGRVNMYEIRQPDFNARFFDVEGNVHYSGDKTPIDIIDKWKTGNYIFLHTEGEPYWFNKEPVRSMMVPKRTSGIGPLDKAAQLSSRPGGDFEYAWNWFGKQRRTGKFADDDGYILNPKTWMTARNQTEGKVWVDSMERARHAWNGIKDKKNPTLVERAIIEETQWSYDKWAAATRLTPNHPDYIDVNSPFELLPDGVEPQAMTGMGTTRTRWHNLANTQATSAEQYYNSRSRNFSSSQSADRLPDPHNERAEVLDPFTHMNRGTATAMHTQAFSDYNRMVIDEWVRMAEPLLKKGSYGEGRDNLSIFFNAELDPQLAKLSPNLYTSLEANRKVHKAFMGMREPNPTTYEYNARRFGAWVEGKGQFGRWAAQKAYQKTDTNPQAAVRAAVYDPWLGFYDSGSLFVQTQTAVAAMTLEPKFGLQAAGMNFWNILLLTNKSDNVWDFIAKHGQSIHGLDPKEYKQMMKALQTSKSMRVGGEMIQLNDYAGKLGGGTIAKGAKGFVRGGRIFQFLAEKYNRMTAWQIAWNVVKRDHPDLTVGSKEFIDVVSGQANSFAWNMTKSSQALWQTGWVGALPAQFASYQARMLEKMLPEFAGGDPLLSSRQRARLWMGQAVLYGSRGIVGGGLGIGAIGWMYQQATGKSPDPELMNTLHKGFWDWSFNALSGGELETDVSSRLGTGAALAMYWEKARAGDFTSALENLTGPAGTMVTNFSETLDRINYYFRGEQSQVLSPEAWERVAADVLQNIASTRRATKAYWIWKYGYVINPRTGTPIFPATQAEGYAAFLGFPLKGDSDRIAMFQTEQERRELIDDIAQKLAFNEREVIKALGGEDGIRNDTDLEYYTQNSAGVMLPFRDDVALSSDILTRKAQILSITGTEMEQAIDRMNRATGGAEPTFGDTRGRFE